MYIYSIYKLLTILLIDVKEIDQINLNDFISDYQQIKAIEDPIFWLSCGAFICIMSGLIFAYIMKSKLNNWGSQKLSPLPLENPQTISSWFCFFSGLTIIFISVLNILNFSILKSFIFSSIISIVFGLSMWKAIKDLLVQVEAGTVKEIDDFF